MSKVTVLGAGAMGSRMAARLLQAGHSVTLWNRTQEKLTALTRAGASSAVTPRAAVREADFVITMVRDDEASRSVWLDPATGALPGLPHGCIGIESSTLSIGWSCTLAERCAAAGVSFLDAPVVGSRPQAEAGSLIYLVGGEREVLDRAEPLLRTMGGAVHFAGHHGAGTAVKLAINALFGIQVAALGELLAMMIDVGTDVATAMDIIGATPVCSLAAKGAVGAMLAGNFAPLFPIELVEKDLGYALAAFGSPAAAPMTTAGRGVFARAVRQGLGAENLTAIARLYAVHAVR
ncbi:MAG: NAD(P)-dependent oxidoreductase [Hyphomicrobiales bacterium]|nr:NAD(P)-dependent oxidoreductase [Hyphomicrobiales bacterium]